MNTTFILLSSDYTKSLHLQSDRSLEFHTPGGCHYTTRLPRYGRDIVYDRQSTEALVPAVGVNQDGMGEVYRLNLESGRYMRSFEVDVGGDDFTSAGGGTLQGGINTGSVNTAAIAEQSHNLLAFGTSLGTVELWDPRAKGRAGVLLPPVQPANVGFDDARSEITALDFNRSGMSLGTGSSNGLIHLYDLRSPVPYQVKDQGYGFAVHTLEFLEPSSATQAATMEPKLLTADKRIIKLWDIEDKMPWTSVEPAVDIKSVAWCKDSGMLLTANEGRQQHSFFVPQLGPAPKWCSFLDNLVEEMAEDPNDPNAFKATQSAAYPGYTMVTKDIIEGWKTKMIDAHIPAIDVESYMQDGKMILENEGTWQMKSYLYEYHQSQFGQGESTRQNKVEQAIEKQRESRIRGKKKIDVKVNRRLAERMKLAEEKRERKHAKRLVEGGGDAEMVDAPATSEGKDKSVVGGGRFAQLFEDQDFAVDETSREFQLLNPSTVPGAAPAPPRKERGLTAAEEEAIDEVPGSSSDDSDSESEKEKPAKTAASKKISSADYKRTKRPPPRMQVSSSNQANSTRDRSFGSRAQNMKSRQKPARRLGGAVGEKEISFNPAGKPKRAAPEVKYDKDTSFKSKERRSASGNAFRKM